MNLDLTEEQLMLKDSIEKFILSEYSLEQRQKIVDTTGHSTSHWQTYAELGWLSVPFEQTYGGFGGDMSDVAVLMEEFGKGLVLEPYVENLVLFGRLLQSIASEEQKNELIPKMIAGELRGSVAYIEPQSRYVASDIVTSLIKSASGYSLSGHKVAVPFAADADFFIVSARVSGEQNDKSGIALVLVDAKAEGVSLNQFQVMDGQKFANLQFDNVNVTEDALLASDETAYSALEQALNDVIIASCAEGLGIMQKLQELTVAYTKERKQFGLPIGAFQVLQHRMVDMFIHCEQTRSLLYRALCSWQQLVTAPTKDNEIEHLQNVRGLKVALGHYGKEVAAEAVQLHGGMGMTEEMSVGHYLKRMRMLSGMYGDSDHHQALFNQTAYGS